MAPSRELWPDSLDVAKVGRLSLFVIKRSDKYGIRLKDPESEYRREFHGIEYLPGEGRVQGDRQMGGGAAEDSDSQHSGPDRVRWTAPATRCSSCRAKSTGFARYLETPDAKELFYIFRDQTSAKETYGAGRFFYSAMPKDGHVVLDFNKAYNPPCAFTPYATCPLPPPENRLAVRIEAGEKKYGH